MVETVGIDGIENNRLLNTISWACLIGVTLFFNLAQRGTDLESIARYVYVMGIEENPGVLFHPWVRMVSSLCYFPVWLMTDNVQHGLFYVKLLSMLFCLTTVAFVQLSASRMDIRFAWLVPLLFLSNPFFVQATYSMWVEVIFLLFFSIGIFFWTKSRDSVAVICFAILPLARVEYLGVLFFFSMYLGLKGRYRDAILLFLPYGIFYFLTALYTEDLFWILHTKGSFKGGTTTQHLMPFWDKILYYVKSILIVNGLAVVLLALWWIIVKRDILSWAATSFFLLQVVLTITVKTYFWGRYYLVLSPILVLLAMKAMNELIRFFNKRGKKLAVPIIVLFFLSMGFQIVKRYPRVSPTGYSEQATTVKAFVDDCRRIYGEPFGKDLLHANPWVSFFLGKVVTDAPYDTNMTISYIEKTGENTMVLWDSTFSPNFIFKVPLDWLLNHPDFQLLYTTRDKMISLYLFNKVI